MNTHSVSPRELAVIIAQRRPKYRIGMGAVLSDKHGIFSWGWNHKEETGVHAETYAIERANRKRLLGAQITIAGFWRLRSDRVGKQVCSLPCHDCMRIILKNCIKIIEYFDAREGKWEKIRVQQLRT